MAAKRYEISDEQWEQIKDMFPRARTGRPPKDNRMMFNAILWIARSGAPWWTAVNKVDRKSEKRLKTAIKICRRNKIIGRMRSFKVIEMNILENG